MNPYLQKNFVRQCLRLAGIALLLGLAQPVWAGLTVNGNGTVTDSTTSLVWDQCPYGLTGAACSTGTVFYGTWAGALDAAVAANAVSYKGFTDWRVPNKNELESITKIDSYTSGQPSIDTTAFPNTPLNWFWTSTTYSPYPSSAWIVYFVYGRTDAYYKTSSYYVRLVRSGQSFAAFDAFPTASADLSITMTDGVATAVPGTSVTYTITASNAGPSAVTGATVADTFPAALAATWTCVGAGGGTCSASGGGNLNDSVNLPAGASVTYTVSATISASATGTLSNTATVSSAVSDPNPANNSATDSDALMPQADLSITKTDGVTTVAPGGSVTYTITASNAGPSNAPGTTVADTLPAALTGVSWTCVGAGGGTCTASGSGNISDTINVPAGGSITYTLTATVSGAATGTVSNTAIVTAAGGITDPTPGNNSATDTDTVTAPATADVFVTMTDTPDPVSAGANLTYAITMGNSGPGTASSAQWSSTLPAGTTFVSLNSVAGWTCSTPAVGAGGTVVCNVAALASASSGSFTLVARVASTTPGATVLTNVVNASSATSDPTPGNNSATTTTTVSAVVIDPPPPPEVTIPPLGLSPSCGLVEWPPIVNLGAGEGPAFAADLVAILSNVLGMPLRWVEQSAACGSVVLAGYNGGNLAFIPYGFQKGDARANGVYAVGDGQYHLVRNGQQLTLAPAFAHLEQLAALLPGVAVTQLPSGAIRATLNGVQYVLQPSVAVQLVDAGGGARLMLGEDGRYHFVDAQGNSQVLHPAFAEPATLRRILQGLDLRATVNIALDGTATIDFNGQRYTLVPDLTQEPVPAERAGQDWWQESERRYRLVNLQSLPVRSLSQSFEVR